MKTIENFLRSIFSEANWDYGELKESCLELIQGIEEETREFLGEAIKADRENVAKHAQLQFIPHDEEAWEKKEITREDIKDFYCDGVDDDDDWVYEQMRERDGFTIEIDKDSIINAPKLELK